MREKDACENAIDEIAGVCGCPHWDYAGQVVRDVETLKRQHDEARAELAQLRERLAFANAGLKTLTDAGWTLAGERDALRAILAGRTTPPTDAEIEAHDAATGGFWMVFCEDDFDLDMLSNPEDRDAWVKAGAIGWVPYSDGRPCAWPAAKESE